MPKSKEISEKLEETTLYLLKSAQCSNAESALRFASAAAKLMDAYAKPDLDALFPGEVRWTPDKVQAKRGRKAKA